MNQSQIWSIDSHLPSLEDPLAPYIKNINFNDNAGVQEALPELSERNNDTETLNKSSAAFNSVPRLVIRLPVLEFIKEACQALKLASDQVLRPKPTIGFSPSYSREIDLTNLLDTLERDEKKLSLVSDSEACLDSISNISRAVALNCYGIIRSLRKELICGKQDPTHPNQEEVPNLISSLDTTCLRLQAERINLEDVVIKIVLQQSSPNHYESDDA